MEITASHPDENRYRLVIQSLSSKRVSHRHLFLAATQRQAEQEESLTVAKRQGSRCAPIGGCCQGAWRRLPGSRTLCHWLGEHIWLGWVCPKLEVGTKIRETVSYWSSRDCLGWLLSKLWFGFQAWCCRLWPRVLLLYMVWSLPVCIFNLLPTFRVEYLPQLFGILLHRRFVSLYR